VFGVFDAIENAKKDPLPEVQRHRPADTFPGSLLF
jgi:hypothetical protein